MRPRHSSRLFTNGWLAVLCIAALAACDGGGADAAGSGNPADGAAADGYEGPPRGAWKGDYLDFTITTGGIGEVSIHDVTCNSAAAHCKSDAGSETLSGGLSIEQRSNASGTLEWHVVGDVGPLTRIDGIFMPLEGTPATFTSVQGTLTYAPADCACTQTTFFWSTSFVPPKDPNDPDAGGDTEGPGGVYPDDATPQQIKALERVNWYRDLAGVPLVDMEANINAMATDHCACYWEHHSEYKQTGMSPHSEDASWPEPCYGDLGARASAHGVGGVSEIMAFINEPVAAVDGWMATLYHRLPLTDPGTKAIGYGAATQCDTINSTGSASASHWEVVYPYEGQQDADLQWDGYESPQPPPPPSGYPSGPIITLQFGSGITFTINDDADVLVDENGNPVPHMLLTPKNDANLAGTSTVSVYSNAPLKPDTTYTVSLKGTRVGEPWEKTWSFKTRASGGGGF